MNFIQIVKPFSLNNFIVQEGKSNFLQSWGWGEFQKAQNRDIWRLGIKEQGKLIASALVIKHRLPLGRSYLYCPRGPIFEKGTINKALWEIFLKKIREIGRQERALFFRFDLPYSKLFSTLLSGLRKSPSNVQPAHTLVLNLTKSAEEILAKMKPKTRYNIRLARRKGVKVRQGRVEGDLDKFWELIQITAKRSDFKPHPKAYYQRMIEVLGRDESCKMFVAEYKGKVLAINLVTFFGQRATYLHGGSGDKYRNLMAPYLLQWEQILEAKRRGCKEYDFWGITPRGQVNDSWAGITRFKKGFGGREVGYPGTYDLVLDRLWYRIYRIIHKFL